MRHGRGFGRKAANRRVVRGISPPTTDPNVIDQLGDSITVDTNNYADRLAAANPGITFHNRAVGGVGLTGANSPTSQKAAILAANPFAASLFIGANDLASYADGAYLPAIYSNLSDDLRAAGIKFVLCTSLPQAAPNGNPGGHNAKAVTFNTGAQAAIGVKIDGFVDWRRTAMWQPDATAAADLAKYRDGLHPTTGAGTTSGQGLLYPNYKGEMNRIRGIANDVAQFAFNDVGGQTASATITSNGILVGGLGWAETKTYSVSGGDVRKTPFGGAAGSWGTSGGTVENGDVLEVRGVASATPGGTTNVVLTVGSISDTFTITTAVTVTPVGYSTIAGQQGDGAFSGTWTGSNITIPTGGGRLYFTVYSSGGSRQPVSFKFTKSAVDTAATLYDSAGDTTFWYVDLAAGVYTPSMVSASTFFWVGFQGILATNVGSQSGKQKITPQAMNNPIAFASSQSVPTNSLGIEFFLASSAPSTRNDGSTQRDSLTISDPNAGTIYVSVGTLPSTATPSVDLAGPGNQVVAAFAVTAAP